MLSHFVDLRLCKQLTSTLDIVDSREADFREISFAEQTRSLVGVGEHCWCITDSVM